MAQNDLRTYQRRSVTRESGYHTCNDTTGGECLIVHSQKMVTQKEITTFTFKRNKLNLVNLFREEVGIVAFGGYLFTSSVINITFEISYIKNNKKTIEKIKFSNPINENDWNNIGFHKEIKTDEGTEINDVLVVMTIYAPKATILEFISFDFDCIVKEELKEDYFNVSFHQKTSMHIPHLYYLNYDLPFERYLLSEQKFSLGQLVVLKSCNRCGRFLPININNEINTLSFSLHCKKKAPCIHSLFRSYAIKNEYNNSEIEGTKIEIKDGRVISYYGHQLECKACKKFFVNMPLNPQRNAQQFKEDGLRRRAIEVLINNLLDTNLIHFEFESRTKKEFSKYIWKKFDCRCFKCKKPLKLEEMDLDHTMPLAYLYRLDETATCLCSTHNSQKSDHFPVDYYTENELNELSKITGLSIDILHNKEVNHKVLDLLIKDVVWFYDDFLMQPDYQKIRDGILTADKINDSLKRVIAGKVDLAEEYKKRTGNYPASVTII